MGSITPGEHEFVVVANRLPVDRVSEPDATVRWETSPGGLVTALEPVMAERDGAWVGWAGAADVEDDPFEFQGMQLVPVTLSAEQIAEYYEGFSNTTLWPLYHDVIAPPEYHREWWESYRSANELFATAAAEQAATGATVWVHDYQLQLAPALLRALRPDLRIGYFHHIPFPPYEIFAQLPWRREVVEGLLGADLLGFQRSQDAGNLWRAARRIADLPSAHGQARVRDADGRERTVTARAFPISIDSKGLDALAREPQVRERARQLRAELGDPAVVLLGVDRLDYTKGILHRLKALGELLDEGGLDASDTVMIQVATPSRERVEEYRRLRDEIELIVGRINGRHSSVGRVAVSYLHQSYPRSEMAALYQVADVLLVTSLRDGMNLVAKEFVACRTDDSGVLILSEFTGAADQLNQAVLVNPHDIEGLKSTIVMAAGMSRREQSRRMRSMRRRVLDHDVARWAGEFLAALTPGTDLEQALRAFCEHDDVLVVLDFDGTLAPLVDDPSRARMPPSAAAALRRLAASPRVQVALLSGRSLADLRAVAGPPPGAALVAGHGAELDATVGAADPDSGSGSDGLGPAEDELLGDLTRQLREIAGGAPGTRVEVKPTAAVLHTRRASPEQADAATSAALAGPGSTPGVNTIVGKDVVEISVVDTDKGRALNRLRERFAASVVLFAGDDTTDENAFAALRQDAGDIGIKVGDGETEARFRVASPAVMATVLVELADRLA